MGELLLLSNSTAPGMGFLEQTGDLLHAAKPITAGRNTTASKVRAGWLTEGACSPCPSFCPSTVVLTTALVFDI